ncbi:aspartate oxidase [Ancylobacter polymorphus]|uniref:Aspartate oxidase n=1 Tax=Ancylobacter polymorphus TaxID=223390 RepID=A0ABU0BHJ6_9HYPH|nr:aspartate oxidase [Ancylobacter polymorphus]
MLKTVLHEAVRLASVALLVGVVIAWAAVKTGGV